MKPTELSLALTRLLDLLHQAPGVNPCWLAPGVLYAEITTREPGPQPEFLVLALSPAKKKSGGLSREDVRELVHRLGGGLRAH